MSSSSAGVTDAAYPPFEAPDRRTAERPFADAAEQLLAELDCLRQALHYQVLHLRAAGLLVENDFRGLYVSDENVDAILSAKNEPQPPAVALAQAIKQDCACNAARARATVATGHSLPLDRVTRSFGLSAFERQVLVACVAPEIDLCFETLYSYVQNDVNQKRPTVDLLLKMFGGSLSERLRLRPALVSGGALLRHGLIHWVDDPQHRESSTLARALGADQHIADYLLEQPGIDWRLRPFSCLSNPARRLADLLLPRTIVEDLAGALIAFRERGGVMLLRGPDGMGKRSVAETLSAEQGRRLLAADLRYALSPPVALPELLLRLQREAALHSANLFLANAHSVLAEKGHASPHLLALEQWLAQVGSSGTNCIIFLGSEQMTSEFKPRTYSPLYVFDFPYPGFEHRERFWRNALGETGLPAHRVDPGGLANKFVLTGGSIHAACRSAAAAARLRPDEQASLATDDCEAAARAQSNSELRRLAHKVVSNLPWSELEVQPRALQQLREVCAAYKYRYTVYSDWGFNERLAMGKGLNVLFWGPSGTGKTMAAGILARELGLDMYKIDLSSVVSKYIGETEKQLNELFREAQTSNAILFFDEADALFGKRSEVRDAHDRYANVETAYLLQKMEEYEGIVILTTNFRKNMDDAFARRMHHVVEFSFPDPALRLRIWKGLIPTGCPLAEDVDLGFLARQFELAGGNIRNAVLAAAFLAAEQGCAIAMKHLVLATAREMLKLGKLPSRSEFRQYFDLIHSQL